MIPYSCSSALVEKKLPELSPGWCQQYPLAMTACWLTWTIYTSSLAVGNARWPLGFISPEHTLGISHNNHSIKTIYTHILSNQSTQLYCLWLRHTHTHTHTHTPVWKKDWQCRKGWSRKHTAVSGKNTKYCCFFESLCTQWRILFSIKNDTIAFSFCFALCFAMICVRGA